MTTIVDGMPLDKPAGFWRRMCAGAFDILFLMTAALVLLLEIMVAVLVATHSSGGALDTPETAALMDCPRVDVVWNVHDPPADPLLHANRRGVWTNPRQGLIRDHGGCR